MPVVELLFVG